MGRPPRRAGRGPRRDRGRGLRLGPVVPRPRQHRPRAVRTAGLTGERPRPGGNLRPARSRAITPRARRQRSASSGWPARWNCSAADCSRVRAVPGSPPAAATAACASASAASHAVSRHTTADRSAAARWRRALGRSPARAHAIVAGTASMIEQNWQKSSQPSVDSARSTMAWPRPAGRGQDHRAEDAVQQVLGHDRAPGQRERPLQQPPRLRVVALGQPDLGEPLQRVRLARGGPEVAVQGAGLGQLGRGEVQVAGEQRRLADQRRGERGGPPRAAAPAVPRRSRASSMTSAYGVGPYSRYSAEHR